MAAIQSMGRYWPAGWIRSRPRLLEGMSAIWGSPENISSMGVFPSLTQLGHLTASRRNSSVSVPTVAGHGAGFLLGGMRAAPLSLPPWRWARFDPEGRPSRCKCGDKRLARVHDSAAIVLLIAAQ